MGVEAYKAELLSILKEKPSFSSLDMATEKKDGLMSAAFYLEKEGLVKIEKKEHTAHPLTKEGKEFLEHGFPESQLLEKDGAELSELTEKQKKIGIMWAKRYGWIAIKDGRIHVLKSKEVHPLKEALKAPSKAKKEHLEFIKKRGLIKETSEIEYKIFITEKGKHTEFEEKGGIGNLTHSIIVSKQPGELRFRRYNITKAEPARIGKIHHLSAFIYKVKRVFEDLGFEEMEGNLVESTFWNFDALFQPQDHPARELADTFYLEGESELPEEKLVERVKKSHEKYWGYEWSEKEAKRTVLRTHTTPVSGRYLSKIKKGGKKYFSIGSVFRNEATDFKHLAEFRQVEGIIAWEGANFRHLLGILKEFYKRLGFEKIRFRPSYFPYTEPSLEIEVFFEERNEWIELGGAGIFRPEMTKPLCDIYPVLAWGLSLERPLMLFEDLKDIRTFYKNDLDWLNKPGVI
ncbi:phenylalanine--tRNA ligase subunit alpha [Candidatus Micrarchaeota archaeon]|nr:phenylalanine--tRNA ligase subunit alpha [Candidatus Micrarchaeota archaeon]